MPKLDEHWEIADAESIPDCNTPISTAYSFAAILFAVGFVTALGFLL